MSSTVKKSCVCFAQHISPQFLRQCIGVITRDDIKSMDAVSLDALDCKEIHFFPKSGYLRNARCVPIAVSPPHPEKALKLFGAHFNPRTHIRRIHESQISSPIHRFNLRLAKIPDTFQHGSDLIIYRQIMRHIYFFEMFLSGKI